MATQKNINNFSLMSRSGFLTRKSNESLFSNVYIILSIIVIAFIFVGVGLYYMIQEGKKYEIKNGSSYYGKDIALYEPVFQVTAKTVDECIKKCEIDVTCDGITFNNETETCLGTKNGQIREENTNYSAWVKPSDFTPLNLQKIDITKAVLVGFTNGTRNIAADKISNPYLLGNFCYSFAITIKDFYKNYGYWRHVFHRGTQITDTLNYQSWENLVNDIPIQTIGVWIAPFTNNLRIAVTTTSMANTNKGSYNDANVQVCESDGTCYITDMPGGTWYDRNRASDGSIDKPRMETYIEYFDHDLQNIPINRKLTVTVNLRGKDVEVYYNGKINKISRLDGIPDHNKLGLYVMNEKTFGGEISNLLYYPDTLKLNDIKAISDFSQQQNTSI